jgi:hypothetical protein
MIEQIEGRDVTFGRKDPADYCRLPYPRHPLGCPNIDAVRSLDGFQPSLKPWIIRECPGSDPDKNVLIDQIFDLSKPLYLIVTSYPVGQDAEYRRAHNQNLHTLPQFYNLRYWQDRARRVIYDESINFLTRDTSPQVRADFDRMDFEELKMHTIVDLCPEAHGVKIIPTAMHTGVRIKFGKWPPTEHDPELVRYQVAVGGYPLSPEFLINRGLIGRKK